MSNPVRLVVAIVLVAGLGAFALWRRSVADEAEASVLARGNLSPDDIERITSAMTAASMRLVTADQGLPRGAITPMLLP